ncbi:MAG TPA: glycosyltransferase family 4 protein [Geminicoccaceae bacterium]|nr:glycosyltransferase family 4 protein [Geminicoccaceae bacterium]
MPRRPARSEVDERPRTPSEGTGPGRGQGNSGARAGRPPPPAASAVALGATVPAPARARRSTASPDLPGAAATIPRLAIALVAACPFPYPRGTPVRILRMAEALAQRGHRVHVVTYHLGNDDPAEGVLIHRTRPLRSYAKVAPGPSWQKLLVMDPLLLRLLAAVIREQAIQIVHAHHYEGLMVGVINRRRHGPPLIYDAHTMLASELPSYRVGLPHPLKRALGGRIDAWLPRLADHIVTVTDTIRDRLVDRHGLAPERVTTVPNGIELEHFAAVGPACVRPGEPRRIVFAGNLAGYQRVDLLLEAFALVRHERPAARLVLAADGDFAPYAAQAAALGVQDAIEVVDGGSFAGLPAVLGRAEIAVNPRTQCDGMPVKLLNYMAAGMPAVSCAGAAPGVVHGETGWVVPNDDAPAFARGIVALLDDPGRARRLGAAARSHVAHNYRWPVQAERLEELYLRLLRTRA